LFVFKKKENKTISGFSKIHLENNSANTSESHLALSVIVRGHFLGEVISRVRFGWIRSGPGIVAGLPGQGSRKWKEIKPRPDQPGPHLIMLKRFCFVLRAMNFGCKT